MCPVCIQGVAGERVLIKLLAIVCRAVCPQPPAPSSGGGAHVWYDCFFEETVEETLKLTATGGK